MKLNALQRAQRLHLYGLVQSLSYLVRLNDFKTAQNIRARLAWVLRKPSDLAKARRDELDDLFEATGQWVRNIGNRHETKLQIQELIRGIVRDLKSSDLATDNSLHATRPFRECRGRLSLLAHRKGAE